MQTGLSGADLYYWFVADFGNTYNLDGYFSFYVYVNDVRVLGSVVSLSVQIFFARRLFVLSENRSAWLCVIICLVSFHCPQKLQTDLTILLIALHCRHISGIRSLYS